MIVFQWLWTLILMIIAPVRTKFAENTLEAYRRRSIVGKCLLVGVGLTCHVVAFRWIYRNERTSHLDHLSLSFETIRQAEWCSFFTGLMYMTIAFWLFLAVNVNSKLDEGNEMVWVMKRLVIFSTYMSIGWGIAHIWALDNSQYPLTIMEREHLDFFAKFGVVIGTCMFLMGILRIHQFHYAARVPPVVAIAVLVRLMLCFSDYVSLIALLTVATLLFGFVLHEAYRQLKKEKVVEEHKEINHGYM